MSKPRRYQLRRTKGWRLPQGSVSVARPHKWGNPFPVRDGNAEQAVLLFRHWLIATEEGQALRRQGKEELRGKNVGCFCREGEPCHGDVWLEVANG